MTNSPTDRVIELVRDEMRRILELVPRSRWYLFGSVTTAKRPVSDIDLLVVCEEDVDCAKVREAISGTCAQYPIHMLLMTKGEEAEVNFIKNERAIEIMERSCAHRNIRLPLDKIAN